MHYNSNNPLIPHASLSLEKEDYKMQSFINQLSRKMIRKEIKENEKRKTFYIKGLDLFILPA